MTNKNSAKYNSKDDVFARTAKSYDLLCDLFSLFAHRLWKSRLAGEIINNKGIIFLDIAAGTGDIALRVAAQRKTDKKIILGDLCPKMLEIAKQKAKKRGLNCTFKNMNAHDLSSIKDNSIDILSISFAMKICDRDKVLFHAYRVLKPGGKIYCLEAARIPVKWIHKFYLAYMRLCIPIIASIVTNGDKSAHNYLLKGINDFPNQKELKKEFEKAGFKQVNYKNLTFGIVALHQGTK